MAHTLRVECAPPSISPHLTCHLFLTDYFIKNLSLSPEARRVISVKRPRVQVPVWDARVPICSLAISFCAELWPGDHHLSPAEEVQARPPSQTSYFGSYRVCCQHSNHRHLLKRCSDFFFFLLSSSSPSIAANPTSSPNQAVRMTKHGPHQLVLTLMNPHTCSSAFKPSISPLEPKHFLCLDYLPPQWLCGPLPVL